MTRTPLDASWFRLADVQAMIAIVVADDRRMSLDLVRRVLTLYYRHADENPPRDADPALVERLARRVYRRLKTPRAMLALIVDTADEESEALAQNA